MAVTTTKGPHAGDRKSTTADRRPRTGASSRPKTSKRPGRLARVAARVVLPLLLVTCVLGVLGYAVFPTRTWLTQRDTIADRHAAIAEIEAENAELSQRVTLLGTDAEIERIARIDHGLVKPGEEAYAVLPSAPAPVRLPPTWPFLQLADVLDD